MGAPVKDELFPTAQTCGHGRPVHECPFCVTRSTDPDTSLAAARTAIAHSGTIRRHVLDILRRGPLTDQQLVTYFAEHDIVGTPSGIRTRRKELADDGIVFRHEVDGITDTGRKAARWYANTRREEQPPIGEHK
jgi:hypothetical protein